MKKKVLIVDDEEDLTWSISRSLRRGHKSMDVICLNKGNDALEMLRNQPVDVLVTDLRMPDVNGFDLIEFIHQRKLKTRIIVMTAYGSSELQHQILMTDGCQYIEKPFEISRLKEKIQSVVNTDFVAVQDKDVLSQLKRILDMTDSVENLRVSIFHDDKTGRLFFSNGEIYRAEFGPINGKEALQEILGWKNCLLKAETLLTAPDYSNIN